MRTDLRRVLEEPGETYPWRDAVWCLGLAALTVVGLQAACGTAGVAQCQIEAVRFLPSDPKQVTPYDVQDLVGRLQACRVSTGDAGR